METLLPFPVFGVLVRKLVLNGPLRLQVSERNVVLTQRLFYAKFVNRSNHSGRKLNLHVTFLRRNEDTLGLEIRLEDMMSLVIRVTDAIAVLSGYAGNGTFMGHLST